MLRSSSSTVAVVVAVVVAGATAGVGVAQLASGPSATDGAAVADASVQNMTQNETAAIRAIHAAPDAPNVDVFFDDELVLDDLGFGNVTDYLEVAPGEHTFTVTEAGNRSAVLFDENITLEAGQRYSAVARGGVAENATVPFDVTLFEDATETPAEGNASVRLVHLSPDAPAVDVVFNETGEVLFENVSFGNASDYVTVPAGDYTLDVRPAGNETTLATFDVTLVERTASSALALGYLTPEDDPGDAEFDLVVVTDLTAEGMVATPTPGEGVATPTPGEGVATPTETPIGNQTAAGGAGY